MGVSALLRRSLGVRSALSIALPLTLYFALRTMAFASTESPPLRDLGAGRRALTVLEAVGRYGGMLVDPFHSRTSIGMVGEVAMGWVIAGVVVLAFVVAAAHRLYRRGTFGPRIGALLAVVAFVPVVHLIPFTLAGSVTADRLLYVPTAGLAIALACAASTLPGRFAKASAVAAIVFAFALGIGLRSRAKDYQEELAFWTVAGENAHPHNTLARMSLASMLLGAVETDTACALYEKSVAILETSERAGLAAHRRARENLTSCWARLGRYDASLRLSEELALAFPKSARIQHGLQLAHLHVRAFGPAIADYARIVSLDEPFAARYGIPPERIERMRLDEARFAQLSAVQRAEHLAALGRGPEANAAYLALALDPETPAEDRHVAVAFLIVEGPLDDAIHARTVVPPPRFGWWTSEENVLSHRRAVHTALGRLRERIDALAR